MLGSSFKDTTEPFTVINCYGPYVHRTSYWNRLVSGGLLGLPNLILARDLNFTLSSAEVWGLKARLDPLALYFSQLISGNLLVDLSMDPCTPTWRNGRSRDEGICKRLDRFLVSESLLPSFSSYRSWAYPSDVSDHYPICLEWGPFSHVPCRPFKFNRAWLMEVEFKQLVWSSWNETLVSTDYSHMELFTHKLSRLKCFVKKWEKTKNIERQQPILDINKGISDLLLEGTGILSESNKIKWDALQEKKSKYWAQELTTLRLKIRAPWLKEGDANTKFFHLFASARRNTNTIWSLNGQDGLSIEGLGSEGSWRRSLQKSFL